MKRIFWPIVLVVLLALVLGSSACDPTDTYAAVVNGVTVKSSTVDAEIRQLAKTPSFAQGLTGSDQIQPNGKNTVNAQLASQVVYYRVLVSLIEQELKRRHITVTAQQRDDASQSVRTANDPQAFDRLSPQYRGYLVNREAELSALITSRNSPAAQRAYYDANADKFAQTCLSDIIVHDKATADALKARIDKGEDFAAIAKTNSLDNQGPDATASKGGAVGCLTGDNLASAPQVLTDAIKSLKVGDTSAPISNSGVFHLVKVTARTEPKFEDVQAQISKTLGDSSQLLSDLLTSAKIKVNPRYGTYQPAGANGNAQVVPHPSPALTPLESAKANNTVDPNSGGADGLGGSGSSGGVAGGSPVPNDPSTGSSGGSAPVSP